VKKPLTADPDLTYAGAPEPAGIHPRNGAPTDGAPNGGSPPDGAPKPRAPHDAALQAALEQALRHRDFTAPDVTNAVGAYARQARARGTSADAMLDGLRVQLEQVLRPRTRAADYEVIAPYLARRAVRAYHQPR